MNDKGHFFTSIAKSLFRIWGAIFTLQSKSVIPLAALFLIAETLGIVEEFMDKR